MKASKEKWVKRSLFWFALLLAWSGLLFGSYLWNYTRLTDDIQHIAQERAKALFQFVEATRFWNANNSPLYAPVTEETPQNPHLHTSHRDIIGANGQQLTQINPAYMTRQLAEVFWRKEGTQIHLTSLLPLRKKNAPDPWESQALSSFKEKGDEYFEFIEAPSAVYRYMAPLMVRESCLDCHRQQGYRLGDVRGGISITLPAKHSLDIADRQKRMLTLFHSILWGVGCIAGFWFRHVSRRQLGEILLQERAATLALIDGLTGLANRRHLDETLQAEWDRGCRTNAPLSVVMVDVDFFKKYNDHYGHGKGDECLIAIAKTLQSSLTRSADLATRYGGEEFVLILPNTPEEGAFYLAEIIRGAIVGLQLEHQGLSEDEQVTISLGVATTIPCQGSDIAGLLKASDRALYRAKELGRNQTVRFSELTAETAEAAEIVAETAVEKLDDSGSPP